MTVFRPFHQLANYATSSSRTLITISMLTTPLVACEKPTHCTINSECGSDFLCREGICKPKCLTYLTCNYTEGEACVDGACDIPTADYCSHVVPTQTPPDMTPYAPCPPSLLGDEGVAGEGAAAGTEATDNTDTTDNTDIMAGSEMTAGTEMTTETQDTAGTEMIAGTEALAGTEEMPTPETDAGTEEMPETSAGDEVAAGVETVAGAEN